MDSGQQDNTLMGENTAQAPNNDLGQSSLPQASGAVNMPQISNPAVPTPSINSSVSQQTTSSVGSPSVAEDVDLIEKEWVNKAKKIVESTRNDPSQQNIQLNKFKADYLKTRFNKDIKPMDG